MNPARESIELLGQLSRILWFEGAKHGLRDREWMALRFLSRANRFSRTPSALASYAGTIGIARQLAAAHPAVRDDAGKAG